MQVSISVVTDLTSDLPGDASGVFQQVADLSFLRSEFPRYRGQLTALFILLADQGFPKVEQGRERDRMLNALGGADRAGGSNQ
jgi:hypothetical protein